MPTITNSDPTIGSSEVFGLYKEMEAEYEGLKDAVASAMDELDDALDDDIPDLQDELNEAQEALDIWESDYLDDLKELRVFIDELGSCDDGETLVHEDYFEEYARELAEDLGYMDKLDQWPYNCIDWEKAAEELLHDYSSAEWGAATYYFRSC